MVPADNKWFTRLVIAAAIVEAARNSTSHTRKSTRRRRTSWRRRARSLPARPHETFSADCQGLARGQLALRVPELLEKREPACRRGLWGYRVSSRTSAQRRSSRQTPPRCATVLRTTTEVFDEFLGEEEAPPMSTTISILGGVGLFLLGMTVMTEGSRRLRVPRCGRSWARRRPLRSPALSGAPLSRSSSNRRAPRP